VLQLDLSNDTTQKRCALQILSQQTGINKVHACDDFVTMFKGMIRKVIRRNDENEVAKLLRTVAWIIFILGSIAALIFVGVEQYSIRADLLGVDFCCRRNPAGVG